MVVKPMQFMLFMEVITVCSKIRERKKCNLWAERGIFERWNRWSNVTTGRVRARKFSTQRTVKFFCTILVSQVRASSAALCGLHTPWAHESPSSIFSFLFTQWINVTNFFKDSFDWHETEYTVIPNWASYVRKSATVICRETVFRRRWFNKFQVSV
jgi:hypothetical protein